ncbi:MAG: PqqD family protein [Lachnospiraceae bacterium]|nr:PqqD family protein [Lachnospiraceae bacterium]
MDKRVRCSKFISWQIEPNLEFVYIFNHKNSQWIYLDGISKIIWEKLMTSSIREVCKEIMQEFDVEEDVVSEDILELVDSLVEEGVLEI